MEATNVSTQASGWNEVTILAHLVALIAEHDRRYEQRFLAQEQAVRLGLESILGMLVERDIRYTNQFTGQDEAVKVALAVVNKEFHEHLLQVRDETTASMMASDKAISKSESSIETRLASMNEFRAQLAEQASSFMPRKEYEASHGNLSEKVESQATRFADSFTNIGSRLDLMSGRAAGSNLEARLDAIAKQIDSNSVDIIAQASLKQGAKDQVLEHRQNNAAMYAAIGIGVSLITFLMPLLIYLATKGK